MNWAAIFSFLHPMLTVLIASGFVLTILKKEYSMYLEEDLKVEAPPEQTEIVKEV